MSKSSLVLIVCLAQIHCMVLTTCLGTLLLHLLAMGEILKGEEASQREAARLTKCCSLESRHVERLDAPEKSPTR